MYKKIFFLISFLLFVNNLKAQQTAKSDTTALSIVGTSVSMHLPGADLKDRFGYDISVNFNFARKTKKNFTYNIEVQNIIGTIVKNEDAIFGDVAKNGVFTTAFGEFADVRYSQRGMHSTFQVGKLLTNVFNINRNSGLWLQGGLGYFWNKIRVEDANTAVPLLTDEYVKGYDMLSAGISTVQTVGFLYLSDNNRLNFNIAFEFMQAYTKNQRGYSYRDKTSIDGRNLDLTFGIKIGWMVPLHKKARNEYYY